MSKTVLVKVENEKQNGKKIKVENQDKKKLGQTSCKNQPKSQKIAKSEKWI